MRARGIDATTALVRQVRTRLWLAALLRELPGGLWLGGGLLLLGGLCHLLLYPLSMGMLLLLALLPPVLALLHALFRRCPTLAQSARQADAWFEGHALITSAWELRQQRTLTPTAALVRERAARAADAWRDGVARQLPLRWPQAGTLALLLAATGLLLLQLPSKAWLSTPAATAEGRSLQTGMGEAPLRLQSGMPASRPAASLAGMPEQAPRERAGNDQVRPAAGVLARDLPLETIPATRADTRPLATNSLPAPRNDGGSRAGDQAAARGPPLDENAAVLAVAEQALPRHAGDRGNSGAGDGAPLDASRAPQAGQAAVRTASQVTEIPYRADYPPALRHYIARYFQDLQASAP